MRRRVRGLTGIKVVTKAGGRQYKYRRVEGAFIPLPNLPENHPDFIAAYVAAGDAAPKLRHAAGTISALCEAYLGSHEYRRMAESTRGVLRRTLDHISKDRGKALVRDLRPDHLRKDVRALTPGSAQNRLKGWRSILKFAVEEGWIESDPSTGVKAPRGEVKPHRQWTLAEIEQFRQHWKVGSRERTAFEVVFWTGARCVDAVTLGWQKVDKDGWLTYVQSKTQGPATSPIRHLPKWAASMAKDHKHLISALPTGQMLWITISNGKPRGVKGLSQWISKAASIAGLPDDCTAHGLRKARAAALAVSGATTSQIGAWTGHASLSEIAHYTRQADQKSILGANTEQVVETDIKKFPNSEN